MQEWLKISCLLCMFGFVREIRPSEPFVTEFLLGEWRNITQEQLNRNVYPVGTYSYLAQLIIVFLITDYLRYKPLIITIGAVGIVVWSMLLWTTSLWALQVLEVFYGTYMAAEVAYFTYIYAKVDKKHFPKVTSHTRAAMFAGKLVAGITAQLLVNLKAMNYRDLNYITLATQIIATILALLLPSVRKSVYFHRKQNLQSREASSSAIASNSYSSNTDINSEIDDSKSTSSQVNERLLNKSAFELLWLHFYNAYTNLKVLQWSIWYAVGLCGYLQVISYVQILWKDIDPDAPIAWNGAVDAVLTALATLSALSAGYIHAGRLKPLASLMVLAGLSVLEGGAILLCCMFGNIYVSYVGFVLYGALYAFAITVASAEVARYLEEDSFGLVFGVNTFMALVLQTILTLIVISEEGFALSAKGQYITYAFYFIIIGIIYFIAVVLEYFVTRRKPSQTSDSSLE